MVSYCVRYRDIKIRSSSIEQIENYFFRSCLSADDNACKKPIHEGCSLTLSDGKVLISDFECSVYEN